MKLSLQLHQQAWKPCAFCQMPLYLILKMQLLCGCRIVIKKAYLQTNMSQKVKSLYDNLKQKEGEGSKAWECNASKGWFDDFRKTFGF